MDVIHIWAIFRTSNQLLARMKQQALFCNHNKKFIYILIVLSSSSDFGCNWVKSGTKHNAVEEKLEGIKEQVGLDEEDEITMRVFGKNANSKDPSIDVETDYPSKQYEQV